MSHLVPSAMPFQVVLFGPLPENVVYPCKVYGKIVPHKITYGYTLSAEKADIVQWQCVGTLQNKDTFEYTEHHFPLPRKVKGPQIVDYPALLMSRTAKLTEGALKGKHVGFVGTGASINLIVSCARTGVDTFSLWDLDIVEGPNIGRTAYDLEDIGQPKTRAAHRHVLHVNPHATVHEYHGDFLTIPEKTLKSQMAACDVIVMGTDVQQVQLRGNRIGHALGKEMLFPGFYTKGAGGEIVVVTNNGPCYRCQVRSRFEQEGVRDLKAESGLIFDCDHVDSVVGKLILSLLLKDDVPSFKKIYEHATHNSLIFFKNDPDMIIEGEDLFGQFFGNTGLAYAYETLWLDPRGWRDPDCEICGSRSKKAVNHEKEEMLCHSGMD